jgi:hypothetical protein
MTAGRLPSGRSAQSAEGARSRPHRRHEVVLPAGAPFANVARASFTFTRTMTVDALVDWLATYSGVITAPETERADGLARARAALRHRASPDGMIEVPMRSACWRADRGRR